MKVLFMILSLFPLVSLAETHVVALKDEAYVVDLKMDEENKLARVDVKEFKGELPKTMQLKIYRRSKNPLKLNLKLVPNAPQAYEGKLHSPYGSYAAAAFEIRFDIGGKKRVLMPSK